MHLFLHLCRFETSEMLATFLASTPLLPESWKLCSRANYTAAPESFVTNHIGDVTYIAFSGVQSDNGLDAICRNLVPLDSSSKGLFPSFHGQGEGEGEEDPVMVHEGFLHLFWFMYHNPTFQNQVSNHIWWIGICRLIFCPICQSTVGNFCLVTNLN